MNSVSYNPKEILSTLTELEGRLKCSIDKHCPDRGLILSDDLDKALEQFLELKSETGDEVAYLSSQLALLHLQREVEKTIGVVVDSNNLRACHDFSKAHKMQVGIDSVPNKRWNTNVAFLITFIIGLLVTVALFFW
ncbi:hypothetical protein [Sphingobacterium paucimobilis]|uniref:Uncharacterized protein n=1 Tax=Sphingobacterium paucimobilis HER1398 TaxID=1346330 RepID=U2J444_9SPHI|nr:hypothetical protein [Sphingobacterium paucimobilis]ERJ57418.1 hypothetical protein M472_01430 [Sphingobacterium paucimobilis HER1398]